MAGDLETREKKSKYSFVTAEPYLALVENPVPRGLLAGITKALLM